MSDKIRVGDRVYTNPANPVYGTVVLKVPKADGDPFRYRVHLDYMESRHGVRLRQARAVQGTARPVTPLIL